MVEPLEVQREYLHNNPHTDVDFELEVMIDEALKYGACDNIAYCTLCLPGLSTFDIKVLAKYIEAGYDVNVKYIGDNDYSIQLTVYYAY